MTVTDYYKRTPNDYFSYYSNLSPENEERSGALSVGQTMRTPNSTNYKNKTEMEKKADQKSPVTRARNFSTLVINNLRSGKEVKQLASTMNRDLSKNEYISRK